MRRFTTSVVEKWDRTLLPVRPAKPFPGRYPIRIWIKAETLNYFGKPGRMAYDLWQKVRRQSDWVDKHPRIIEFDRGGVVCCMDMANIVTIHESLWKKYHGQTRPDWEGFWFRGDKLEPIPMKPVLKYMGFPNGNQIDFVNDIQVIQWDQDPVPARKRRIIRRIVNGVR